MHVFLQVLQATLVFSFLLVNIIYISGFVQEVLYLVFCWSVSKLFLPFCQDAYSIPFGPVLASATAFKSF